MSYFIVIPVGFYKLQIVNFKPAFLTVYLVLSHKVLKFLFSDLKPRKGMVMKYMTVDITNVLICEQRIWKGSYGGSD